MNYLNEYQTMKKEVISKPKYKNKLFPTYDNWVKAYIQGAILRSEVSPQAYLDIIPNSSLSSQVNYLKKEKIKTQKLSTKERLRKKLLEKKRKELQELEVEEMLKRL